MTDRLIVRGGYLFFGEDVAFGKPGLLTDFSVRGENELEVSSEDRSYMDDEKFGIPHCIQFQDKLDESIYWYTLDDIPWQFVWYQMLHVSQQSAFCFQVTALSLVPHGHLGALGQGKAQCHLLIYAMLSFK